MATKLTSSDSLSNPPRSGATGNKSRHAALLSNVPLLGRTALASRIQQVASKAPAAEFPNLIAFFKVWEWLPHHFHDFIHRKAPYQTYPDGKTGIFELATPNPGPLRIAVAADWGTGTLEAETVAENMKRCDPHYTLHLGDVYYMGERVEVEENCLGKERNDYTGVEWPKGSHGSFALMGNHEMYSGGQGYFDTFLPSLGLYNRTHQVHEPQSASYFCLETEHWLVLGLDTGYHSGGVPPLASVPLINRIPFLNVDARFDDKMLQWLKMILETLRNKGSAHKPIVLLTHHQPISSFEPAYAKPAQQIDDPTLLGGREFVWIYGHEHRLTVYQKQKIANTLTVHPRCIGHGGMPAEVTRLHGDDPNILYYDPREHPIDDKHPETKVAYNGHIVLLFHSTKLTIEYRDILYNNVLLTETFTPVGSTLQHAYVLGVDKELSSGTVSTNTALAAERTKMKVYTSKRKSITTKVVGILAAVFAALSICYGFRHLGPNQPNSVTTTKMWVWIVWTVGVPAWFLFEYSVLYDPGSDCAPEHMRHIQDLASKVWLAVAAALGTLYAGNDILEKLSK